MILPDILRDTNYRLTQFSTDKINELEENIIIRKMRTKLNFMSTAL